MKREKCWKSRQRRRFPDGVGIERIYTYGRLCNRRKVRK